MTTRGLVHGVHRENGPTLEVLAVKTVLQEDIILMTTTVFVKSVPLERIVTRQAKRRAKIVPLVNIKMKPDSLSVPAAPPEQPLRNARTTT